MRAGFAVWNERIAPVFDTAAQIHIVEADSGRIQREMRAAVPSESPAGRVMRLVELRLDELVCGAISHPLRSLVAAYGIRVYPFVSGPLDEIVEAWLTGRLGAAAYAMPGCCGRRGHGRGFGALTHQEVPTMPRMDGRGPNPRQGQGRGRMGGRFAGGPGGFCICPLCGHKEPHERGVPCNQRRCPTCGVPLTRE